MSAAVRGEDLVVEVFDAETQTRHADVFQGFQFRLLNRAGLTLERDLFSVVPRHVPVQTVDEITQLFLADVRRSAAAEISKAQLSSLKSGRAAVELVLFNECVEIDLDLGRVFVDVDFEV